MANETEGRGGREGDTYGCGSKFLAKQVKQVYVSEHVRERERSLLYVESKMDEGKGTDILLEIVRIHCILTQKMRKF